MHSLIRRLAVVAFAAGISAATLPCQAAPCAASPAGLAGFWRGEDTTDSVSKLNGTWRGNGSTGAGYVRQGFQFGGSHDALLLPASFQLTSQEFAVEGWIRRADPNLAGNDAEAGEFFANSDQGLAFGLMHDGRLYLSHIGVVSFRSTTAIRDTNWHHVAVVRSASELRFFADGLLASTTPCNVSFSLSGPYALGGLGSPYAGVSYGFKGNIDELAAYNRPLSQEEVFSIFSAGAAGRCSEYSPIPVSNSGFEALTGTDPVHFGGDGKLLPGHYSSYPGFPIDGNGYYSDLAVPGWSGAVSGGTFRPQPPLMPNGAPEGVQVGWINGFGSISQQLSETYQAGHSYRLRVDVGRLSGVAFPGYALRLLANNQVVAEQQDAVEIPAGGFTTATLEVTLPPGSPFAGTPIRIQLATTAANGGHAEFDRVRLESIPGTPPLGCTPIPAGLVAWYRAEGDANNITGANNGAFGAPKYAAGKVGRAFDFDGSNEVVVPDSAAFNLAAFAAEAWIFPTSLDGDVDIILNKEVFGFDTIAFEFGLKGPSSVSTNNIPVGNLALHLGGIAGLPDDYSGWTDSGVKVPLNEWSHVVVAYENGVASVFLNGALGKRFAGLTGSLRTVSGPLKIGSRADSVVQTVQGTRFNGRIDEVSIFNRALAESEVAGLFNAQEQGKCFRDLPVGDVSLTLTGASRAALGEDFVVTATVSNHGLAPAPGIMLTNVVPTGVSVVNVTSSQGTADNLAGFVIANLGILPGGESATVRITCRALLNGNYTISSTLGRADTDPEPANNQGTLTFEALPLTLALGEDITVRENAGRARIPVVLSAPVTREIDAGFRLVEGSAKADADYRGTNGSVRLPAGATEAFIEVPVINDFFFETAETFAVELFTTNVVALGKTNGVVTIENDDPRPLLAVSDVVLREGNSGGTNAVFTVSLTGASEAAVTVDYATVSGTASAPTDYLNATGTLTFTAGERAKTVEVRVNGDTSVEANESFQLVLSNVANADLADAKGAAAILNDDFVPGQLAGFRWDAIASSPKVGENIPVRVAAVDGGGAVVPAFNGTVLLQATPTGRSPSSVVISEVDATSSSFSRVEFGNVSTNAVDLAGWTVTFYDGTTWPLPTGTVTLNPGTTLPPAGIFQIFETSGAGVFPNLRTEFPLSWAMAPQERRFVAVLLRNASGAIADFFCAMRAMPNQIQVPISIPAEEWTGLPMVDPSSPSVSYQRAGNADSNSARDWATQSPTPLRFANIMTVPFADSSPLAMTPEFAADFQNSVWTGNVQLSAFAPQVALIADDGNGARGRSEPFTMSTADDLAVTLTVDPNQTQHPAQFVHYRAEVTHCCETVSSNVVVEVRLPAYFGGQRSQIAAVTVSQGTHELGTYFPTGATQGALLVRASLGQLGLGQSAHLEFDISRQSIAQLQMMPTNITATATVSRTQPEQNLANNSSAAVTEINAGCTTLPEGALAWWRGEINLTDSLANGALELVGTNSDFLAYGPGRTVNTSALNLDRNRSLQTAAGFQWDLGANRDFSVELWLRVTADALRERIMLLDKRDPATGVGFVVFLDQGRLAAVLTDTAGNTQSHFTRFPAINAAELRDGNWHHVALSARRDPQIRELLLAVDGSTARLVSTLEVVGDLGNATLRLGFEPGAGTTTAFVGLLDEVTVYSAALSSAQLSSLYRAGGAAKCLANVSLSFADPKPVAGQFPNPLSYGRPLMVRLEVTNAGPLAVSSNWVTVTLGDVGRIRHLTPNFGTNVSTPFVTFHDFGPLPARAGRVIEFEVTVTNIPTRLPAELATWQQFAGQNYRLSGDVAWLVINPDGDADELPDVWELSNGYDPLDAADATADTDGDGFRNVDEYLLGTNPRSAADLLKIELISLTESGVQIRFAGKTDKVYGLFRRDTLGADWTEVARRTGADNSVIELTDAAPGANSGFYRIQLITNP